MNKDCIDFGAGKHRRDVEGFLCPWHVLQNAEIPLQGMSIEEKETVKSLVLRRCCDMAVNGKVEIQAED